MLRNFLQKTFVFLTVILVVKQTVSAAPAPAPMDNGRQWVPTVQANFVPIAEYHANIQRLQQEIRGLGINPTISPLEVQHPQLHATVAVDQMVHNEAHVNKFLFLGNDRTGSKYAYVLPDTHEARQLVGHTDNSQARVALLTVRRDSSRVPAMYLNGFARIDDLAHRNLLEQYILGAPQSHDLINLFKGNIHMHWV